MVSPLTETGTMWKVVYDTQGRNVLLLLEIAKFISHMGWGRVHLGGMGGIERRRGRRV